MSAKELAGFLADKKLLVLGFGREGKSSYNFIKKYLPEKRFTVADANPLDIDDPLVDVVSGKGYLDALGEYELVLKSPGIPFRGVARPKGTLITCQTDLYLRFCDCVCVGVTGTKGKTTTSTLIYEMLKAAGRKTCLIGNGGVPVFEGIDMPADGVAVIEMSSHQLEFTRHSPHVALLTNVYEEHLDHYDGGFRGYLDAKLNIIRYQNADDVFIYNAEQGIDGFVPEGLVKGASVGVRNEPGEDILAALAGSKTLRGKLNRFDAVYASTAAELLGADRDAVLKTLREFPGIPNRMEYIGTFGGVDYYNDSIATIPTAVLGALDALGSVGTLIIGGKDRGIDYGGFAEALASGGPENIVCLPETGHMIADMLGKLGCRSTVFRAADMEEAVRFAAERTSPGRACLLSPAAASYNVYKDFEHKGRHYKELVAKYAGGGKKEADE